MAKVYIVSSGSYSDWGIKKIFLNKEKAEAYHNACSDYDLNEIDEYDTSDDEIIIPIPYCEVTYRVFDDTLYQHRELQGDYDFKIYYGNTKEDTEKSLTHTAYYDGKITLGRVIRGKLNEKQLSEKYLKVCQDLAAFIRNEVSINGANNYEIQRLLNNKNIE